MSMSLKFKVIKEGCLLRIISLQDVPSLGLKKGDFGGLLERENNLSQEGNAWVFGNFDKIRSSTMNTTWKRL